MLTLSILGAGRGTDSPLHRTIGIHAVSVEAVNLYRGCQRQAVVSEFKHTPPHVVIIGVQHGGTTSAQKALSGAKGVCRRPGYEVHFFDRLEWMNQTVTTKAVLEYQALWKSCSPRSVTYEKTPNYYMQTWAPLRMCEVFGSMNLVIFLRNPVDRAWSSYFQGSKVVSLPRDAEGFDRLARMEIAIVSHCGGVPSVDFAADLSAQNEFHQCCSKVSKDFRYSSWPGCKKPSADSKKEYHYGLFGDKRASQVRMGLYVYHLRHYFHYFATSDVIVYRSEDLFNNMTSVLAEVASFGKIHIGNIWKMRKSIRPAHANVNVGGQNSMKMWNSTRKVLQEFYTPYNNQLDALLGRKMMWW